MKNYILFTLSICIMGCSPKYDTPVLDGTVSIQSNMTIRELKQLHSSGKFEKIEQDAVIEGVVVADDKSGNFYQSIVLQDNSGGIVVRVSGSGLYSSYPTGRRLYIKTKGLFLGDYGGTIQLGGGIDSSLSYRTQLDGIATGLVDKFIVKGAFNQTVVPYVVTPSQLTDNMLDALQSTLIAIDNMQFSDADVNKKLSDVTKQVSAVSYVLQSCSGEAVVLRNSSYASFADANVPDGNGRLTGIFSLYNSDRQIIIRDTSDFLFSNTRCNLQLADTNKITTIRAVRSLYQGKSATIPFGTVIKGTVISDSKNESSGNYKMQDIDGRGIILYGTTLTNIEFNKSYIIDVGGATLEQFSNELEISKIDVGKIYPTSDIAISAKITNIAQLNDSIENWASTLVQLQNVYISTPTVTTSGRTYTIMDAHGSVETFIRSTAGFNLQPGNAAAMIGYVSLNAGKLQLILRNSTDVAYTGTTIVVPIAFAAEYTFKNVTSMSGTVDPTPAPSVTGLGFGLFRAVGLGSNPSAAGRFAFNYWPLGANSNNNDFTGTIDLNKYYEVTITPDNDATLTLSLIEFVMQRSATGPRQWAVRSSLDNFQSNIAASVSSDKIRLTGDNIFQVADRSYTTILSGNKLLLDERFADMAESVRFRFYAFNAESNAGSFSLNSVRFDGKVE
ncbi:MAG: DUF5689 domain-containing protein [Chitinophagaceae bacterium]